MLNSKLFIQILFYKGFSLNFTFELLNRNKMAVHWVRNFQMLSFFHIFNVAYSQIKCLDLANIYITTDDYT